MKKHVILLAELRSEFASDLLEVLNSAGIGVSRNPFAGELDFDPPAGLFELQEPVAVVCELPKPATIARLRSVMERAHKLWPAVPLVACQNTNSPIESKTKKQLTKLGFRAVAESAAQLPALLREVEESPEMGELPESFKSSPDTRAFALPKSMRSQSMRDAFSLIASLHFAASQKEAASMALDGIARLACADRWSIFVTDENTNRDKIELELLATQTSSLFEPSVQPNQPNSHNFSSLTVPATTVAQDAVYRVEPVRKGARTNWVLALPLLCGEKVQGVLEGIRRRPGSRSFSRSVVTFLCALTTPIAAALSNSVRVAEAERLSQTDELTRLHNARYLRQFLVNEMKRARRFGSKISALFLDLDDFKTVNDLHGHLVGSHALMEVASVILPSVRDTDCVVRYGGDEFVVILPETSVHEAVRVADRIRAKIERHRFTGGRRLQIHLTSSIGLAVFPDDALSPHQLIACADRAMYAAKAANKNCVRVMTSTSLNLPAGETPLSVDAVDGPQFQRIPDEKFIS
jgi:diguanylate cyclase (GGDEF)-like protein